MIALIKTDYEADNCNLKFEFESYSFEKLTYLVCFVTCKKEHGQCSLQLLIVFIVYYVQYLQSTVLFGWHENIDGVMMILFRSEVLNERVFSKLLFVILSVALYFLRKENRTFKSVVKVSHMHTTWKFVNASKKQEHQTLQSN